MNCDIFNYYFTCIDDMTIQKLHSSQMLFAISQFDMNTRCVKTINLHMIKLLYHPLMSVDYGCGNMAD